MAPANLLIFAGAIFSCLNVLALYNCTT